MKPEQTSVAALSMSGVLGRMFHGRDWAAWQLKPPLATLGDGVRRFLQWPLFQLGKVPITPVFLVKCTVFLVVLGLLARLGKRLLARALARTKIEVGQRYATVRAFGYFIFLLGLAIGIDSAGLDLRSLLVVGGALGVGIGFGLQNIVANFVAGLVILWEEPVKLGDTIDVSGTVGEVVKIGARGTWVRTYDNEIIIVPNSEFTNNKVTNWTANDKTVRFSISVGVACDSDLLRVRDLLEETALRNPDVLRDPAPRAFLRTFGDSAMNFTLRVSSQSATEHPWKLQSDLMIDITRVFREQKINMPFPQQDIHVRSVPSLLVVAGPGGSPVGGKGAQGSS
jgi:small-conductance mechanosensitive channel